MSMNETYYKDCEQLEQLMYFEDNALQIIAAVNKGKAYSLEDMIDEKDVESWKEKVVFNYNNRKDILANTQYISEQNIYDYIENCSKECAEYLLDRVKV